MSSLRRPLCSRCGGNRWIVISAREERCAECDLGSVTTEVAFSAHSRILDEAARRAMRAEMRDRFAEIKPARFVPYGLDASWTGLRTMGPWEADGERVSSIELVHGAPFWGATEPHLSVETELLDVIGDPGPSMRTERIDVAQHLFDRFWQETGAFDDALRRAAYKVREPNDGDPVAGWPASIVDVAGQPTELRFLVHERDWLGFMAFGRTIVTLRARTWDPAALKLVAISDTAPYERGAFDVGLWPEP